MSINRPVPGAMLDRLAVGASFACLVHCLFLPVLVAALPALAIAGDEAFHVLILAFAVPTSAVALIAGYREHGGAAPLGTGALGLAALVAGAFAVHASGLGTPLTVVGSLLVAAAHIANWRLRQRPLGARRRHGVTSQLFERLKP